MNSKNQRYAYRCTTGLETRLTLKNKVHGDVCSMTRTSLTCLRLVTGTDWTLSPLFFFFILIKFT